MKKIKRVYVDPPSGWQYGFPRAVPDEFVEDGVIVDKEGYNGWLNSQYPKECAYLRVWVQEEEVSE